MKMKTTRVAIVVMSLFAILQTKAQNISAKWELSDKDNLSEAGVTGDEASVSFVTATNTIGSNMSATANVSSSGADTGYSSVTYTPPFTSFTPSTRVTAKTAGHYVKFSVTPQSGHKFKPTKIAFDAVRIGTDGGNLDVYIKAGNNVQEQAVATTLSPARNKIQQGNSTGFTHYEYVVSDYIVSGAPLSVLIYFYNLNGTDNSSPKAIALRNVEISGAVDEEIFSADHFINTLSCSAGDLTSIVTSLKNGGIANFPDKLMGDPTDFNVDCKEGYTAEVKYVNKVATVNILKDGERVFYFEISFRVSYRQPKPEAKPLNRGLVAVKTSNGMLVSWRLRATDDKNIRFNLYRGKALLNKTAPITATTNYLDKTGSSTSTYTLEVLDKNGNVLERQENVKAWNGTIKSIPTSTPIDLRNTGATYTPNDCSVCDMDGDGEYEIIVKWDPSNSKDAAASGVTGSTYFDCYKLDGTQLWRIDLGQNVRSGAHTTPYLCYDFDGDGYGELIVKTAPGTVDGEGNYVIMEGDNPLTSYINSRGHIASGPEYLTVFDGLTGAEIHTVRYHTCYGDVSTSIWGDSNQNRSDRYLACMAYLDGEHPSAVMCRGYYKGAFVAAYDFDGDELKQRWYSKNITSGKGLWGEGAHSVVTADVDGDGKDEITYGSAALDDDGSLLYRTGLGHGDALHIGDFVPDHEGLEVYMVHEEKPYGYDLRDARTGERLVYSTADGDTGRGLIADFDDEHEGAEFTASCSPSLFDCHGKVISNWQSGTVGSSSLNFRIYWDGDLYDEYMDRAHIDKWDSSTKSFGRVNTLYNNGGATPINGTKNNPNIQADFLGDWREEVVYYNSSDNSLTIYATDIASDYKMPTLMDDRQYAEAVVWQNVGYNQPPHVSFDPIKKFTVERPVTRYGTGDNAAGWDAFFTTYPVAVPEGCNVYVVNGYDNEADTLKLKKISSKYIPANTGILINSAEQSLTFKPTIKQATAVGTNYLKGACVDSVLVCGETTYTYLFRDGEHGLGFYKADGEECEANKAFLRLTMTAANNPSDYYTIGKSMNPTAIESVLQDEKTALEDADIYTLQGVKVKTIAEPGIYIVNGKKTYIK